MGSTSVKYTSTSRELSGQAGKVKCSNKEKLNIAIINLKKNGKIRIVFSNNLSNCLFPLEKVKYTCVISCYFAFSEIS